MTGRRTEFGKLPEIHSPEMEEFVRALLTTSRFTSLTELGDTLQPRRGRQRLSEIARGSRLPYTAEFRAIVIACRPSMCSKMERLLRRARAAVQKPAVAGASRTAVAIRLSDHAVASNEQLPIVESIETGRGWGFTRPSRACSRIGSQ